MLIQSMTFIGSRKDYRWRPADAVTLPPAWNVQRPRRQQRRPSIHANAQSPFPPDAGKAAVNLLCSATPVHFASSGRKPRTPVFLTQRQQFVMNENHTAPIFLRRATGAGASSFDNKAAATE